MGSILRADPLRWHLLGVVAALNLPDCWVAAGFVRNAVWDHLHGRSARAIDTDVDVIWYDRRRVDATDDQRIEHRLIALEPAFAWSVKNQARMHHRNGDTAYASATDAMRHWPETATAVAVRRDSSNLAEIAAPFGLDDLMNLVLRPTARFRSERRAIFEDRICSKNWIGAWPLLKRADV